MGAAQRRIIHTVTGVNSLEDARYDVFDDLVKILRKGFVGSRSPNGLVITSDPDPSHFWYGDISRKAETHGDSYILEFNLSHEQAPAYADNNHPPVFISRADIGSITQVLIGLNPELPPEKTEKRRRWYNATLSFYDKRITFLTNLTEDQRL